MNGSAGATVADTANFRGALYDFVDESNFDRVITNGTISLNETLAEDKTVINASLIFNDNMVFQRNAVNRIWGTCAADGEIAVSFNNSIFYGKVQNGNWEVFMPPMPAGGPYELIVFNKTSKRTFRNILSGEVFLLAGQSNMLMRVNETDTWKSDYNTLGNINIRLFENKACFSEEPLEDLDASNIVSWQAATPECASNFSAIGYYFAQELQKQYPEVPVGLVMDCQGGTFISTWLPEYAYNDLINNGYPIPKADDPKLSPFLHYNAMINPVRKFKVKAVLWYQGEGQTLNYDKALTKLINVWRNEFESPSMGFVIFTLPRLVVNKYGSYETVSVKDWFEVRAIQMAVAKAVPDTTYCVANDLGSYDDIHPLDKKILAIRGCHSFMKKFYAKEGVLSGPVYKYHEIKGDTIIISFDNVGTGLELRYKNHGFEIKDSNGEYKTADVRLISGNTVQITSSAEEPKGFRYAYTNIYEDLTAEEQKDVKNAVCLFNKEGYPAEQIDIEIG